MRRHVGVSAIKKKKDSLDAFSAVGKVSKDQKLSHVKETITSFQTALAEFASKYKDKINADPEFRQQFHVMCSNIGVDPLASNKGFWADILGVGDYYYELGVTIIHICMKTRPSNGGLISIADVVHKIRSSGVKTRVQTTEEDVKRAVRKLAVLGNGFKIIELSGGSYILSVPSELNKDHEILMNWAREFGFVNERIATGWESTRFQLAVTPLLRDGMIWVDEVQGLTNYYFPSIWMEKFASNATL